MRLIAAEHDSGAPRVGRILTESGPAASKKSWDVGSSVPRASLFHAGTREYEYDARRTTTLPKGKLTRLQEAHGGPDRGNPGGAVLETPTRGNRLIHSGDAIFPTEAGL